MPSFSTPPAVTLAPDDARLCVERLRRLHADWPDAVVAYFCGDGTTTMEGVVTVEPRPTASYPALPTPPADEGAEM